VQELVCHIPAFKCYVPDGAFYIFPEISSLFGKTDGETTVENAEDVCMYLLHKANVSTVTGTAFGAPNCIRIGFANSMQNIEKGFARIKEALDALK
jgi:aspartate aminotransferase